MQALNTLVAQTDSYNWGYDPFHYTVPEGSYATDPEGTARIKEFRTMIQAIKQDLGMNVIMDVVYNHTNAAGPTDRTSVLDKIVPWYYQRLNETTGSVESATCCSDSAPEHRMFAKLIADSLAVWTTDYKIDGFRFDLMGYHPKAQILSAWERIKALNPDIYFFGEGWDSNQSKSISKAPGSARSPIVCATPCAAAGRSTPVTHYARTRAWAAGLEFCRMS